MNYAGSIHSCIRAGNMHTAPRVVRGPYVAASEALGTKVLAMSFTIIRRIVPVHDFCPPRFC